MGAQVAVRQSRRDLLLSAGLALIVLAAYANHFQNDFHFDDFHTITTNVFIEDLRNIPRFFTDAALFTAKPGGATYRPVTSASLALDYWLGHGRKPFFFHLSTFLWFVVQVVLMFFLFRRIMDQADPHPSNTWMAWLAAACYGLHPANAETVNYIIQRADLYSTLGVVASLLWFICYPGQRKRGLVPAAGGGGIPGQGSGADLPVDPAGVCAAVRGGRSLTVAARKAPVAARKMAGALSATWPAFVVTGAAAVLIAMMTPATFDSGAASASMYRLTQPWVALHYFKCFFLPTDLSADSNWDYVSSAFSGEAVAGYLFVAALVAAALGTSRRRETRPIAFGIAWFILALLPTSLMPLADSHQRPSHVLSLRGPDAGGLLDPATGFVPSNRAAHHESRLAAGGDGGRRGGDGGRRGGHPRAERSVAHR